MVGLRPLVVHVKHCKTPVDCLPSGISHNSPQLKETFKTQKNCKTICDDFERKHQLFHAVPTSSAPGSCFNRQKSPPRALPNPEEFPSPIRKIVPSRDVLSGWSRTTCDEENKNPVDRAEGPQAIQTVCGKHEVISNNFWMPNHLNTKWDCSTSQD